MTKLGNYSPVEPRLAARSIRLANGCIEWTGSKTLNGYGAMFVNGKRKLIHRYIYEQTHGAIPEGKEINHLCRNKACFNVEHLEAVTHSENLLYSNPSEYNIHRKKTHCPKGHPYDEANTQRVKRGRICATCNRERNKRYHHAVRKLNRKYASVKGGDDGQA